ncbi:hypothetical protein ONZ45_g16270 [Pleurotus djamor]|nr:hypothetical protein ONZ45_g16270 [Pleurotus djamor]
MISQLVFTLAFAALSLAYQVITPGGAAGWTNQGLQPATWQRVETDPLNFTAVLVNSQGYSQILAALVDGSLGETEFRAPNGGWPTGEKFRLNFAQDAQNPGSLLAQSNEFNIVPSTSSVSSTQTRTNPAATFGAPSQATTTPAGTGISNPTQFNAASPVVKLGAGFGAAGFLLGVWALVVA